jgi:DNA-binding MarR family transcriptional regulator
MQAIVLSEHISHSGLSRLLGLDQTTVSRSLAALRRRRLIHVVRGEDRRERCVELTAAGRAEFRRAERVWRGAQGAVKRRCGRRQSDALERALTELAAIAASMPGADSAK